MAMLTTLSAEDLIPVDHPIRRIRVVVDDVLASMDTTFESLYSSEGRPSVPPEALLKASVLMAMYSIRSERAFCERLNYDLLFKWFLDMRIDQPAFTPTTFSKNRKRLLNEDVAKEFFAQVLARAKLRRYTSSDHFSVDGTLLKAWASHKSFKPKPANDKPDTDGSDPNSADPGGPDPGGPTSGGSDSPTIEGRNVERDWKGHKRSNVTHESTTDPEARLFRKSNNSAATLCFSGHILVENRSSLIVDAELATADGYAERATALKMLTRLPASKRRRTVGADKAYDTKDFVADTRKLGFTPHVAQNTNGRRSAIDGRTTRHPGHRASLSKRPRIEEPFGWMKTIAGGHQLRYTGRERNNTWFTMVAAVYNVIRITAIDATPA
jgi:transposase